MITGYWPLPTGRNTSARSTTPSSMVMGASQSMCMPSRVSDFICVAFLLLNIDHSQLQTNTVVPAQAGTHNTAALETAYGFPPTRERHGRLFGSISHHRRPELAAELDQCPRRQLHVEVEIDVRAGGVRVAEHALQGRAVVDAIGAGHFHQ